MNLKKSFPYTEDMIKSERLFLNHLNDFVNNPKLKQFPEEKLQIGNFVSLSYGMNKGEKVPIELKNRLEKTVDSEILRLDLDNIDYKADVVIIGTGGAGLSAAIEAAENGANVLMLTKDKFGLSNTVLAQGGIQAATEPDDSPEQHFEDTIKGGHHKGKRKLVEKLVYEAPQSLLWLESLGVKFKEEPIIPGGSNKKRLHTIGDNTGANIMGALGQRVKQLSDKITIIRYANAQEILKDEEGVAAGIIFKQENRYKVVQAKSVILATGGSGSLLYNNMQTSNCKGSTADGLVIAYHAGAKLIDPGAIQYHPTGGAYPVNLFAVGEVSGGIDGDNRLMGNALASIVVYGRTAGREAAEIAKKKDFSKKLSLDFLLENNFLVSNDLTR